MKLKFFAAGLIALTGAQSNCPAGYEWKRTTLGFECIDINECDRGTHTCSTNAKCTHIINGVEKFTCACNQGKRLNFEHKIMFENSYGRPSTLSSPFIA